MRLRDYLTRHGLTLSDMARRTGLAPSTIYRLMHGHHRPTRDTADRVSKATSGKVSRKALDAEWHDSA